MSDQYPFDPDKLARGAKLERDRRLAWRNRRREFSDHNHSWTIERIRLGELPARPSVVRLLIAGARSLKRS